MEEALKWLLTLLAAVIVYRLMRHREPWKFILVYWIVTLLKSILSNVGVL